MDFSVKSAITAKGSQDALILGIAEGAKLAGVAAGMDKSGNGAIGRVVAGGDFDGKCGSTLMLRNLGGFERVLLVGTGKADAVTDKTFRESLMAALKAVKGTKAKSVTVALESLPAGKRDTAWKAEQVALLAIEAVYRSDSLKSKRAPEPALREIALLTDAKHEKAAQAAAKRGAAIGEGMNLTRELGDLPGNICTPTHLAETAKKLGKQFGMKITVLERKDMEKLGMNTLLSVTRGSDEPPKFVTLEYNGGKKGKAPLALVGKGITFDTGGISLKPGAEMDEMKYDMCGAGTVLGTMKAIALMKLPVNVVGVIAACENMPSGKATKPGDIVKSMNGITVEVLNTDAEGRLILADALTYTERFKPAKVVDIATLTGAMVIALGPHTTGVFANDDALAHDLVKAGDGCYDRAWHMPLFAEYDDMLKSNFADLPNITGGRAAGSITAACFLSRFTTKYKWAHMDIAGTAWKSGSEKGATGRPVPLLAHWVASHA